jgi:hypothetical protein
MENNIMNQQENHETKAFPTTVGSNHIKLVTFDVFDTLISRRVCSAHTVHYFVGRQAVKHGLIDCSPEVYIGQRL